MNWRTRRKILLAAVEIYSLHLTGTTGGLAKKLAELEQHIKEGGKLRSGVLFPDSSRRTADGWLNWALDVKGCLPDDHRERLLVTWFYGIDRSFADTFNREMPEKLQKAAQGPVRRFWGEMRRRRLIGAGEGIVMRMEA